MKIIDFATTILFGTTLAEKLVAVPPSGLTDALPTWNGKLPDEPGRPAELAFKPRTGARLRTSFPEARQLETDPEARGIVLHAFANHELLAMELMALALLRFHDAPAGFRAGLAATIVEEQRHLALYRRRMADFGLDFGAVPVNRFFWDAVATTPSPLTFVTQMALTLEQANLDFATHYRDLFRRIGDAETAALLDLVHREEIGHVKHGLTWFNRWRDPTQTEWDAYRSILPLPLSPGRAKGMGFDAKARRAAGFSEEFIAELAVHNNSKGRPSVVFWFNPGCEDEVADGRPAVVLPKTVRDLQHDLAGLMLFLALDSDVVLVEERPRAAFLATLTEIGVVLPEFVTDREASAALARRSVENFEPWGKSPAAARRAEQLALRWRRPFILPKDPHVFAKTWSANFREGCTICRTVAEAERAIAGWHERGQEAVLKAPLGSSGRRMHRIAVDGANATNPSLRYWIAKIVAKQGAVIVEPWLEKLVDLSVQIEVGATTTHVLGITRFLTDARGRYFGHVLGRKFDDLPQRVVRAIHETNVYPKLESIGVEVGTALAEAGYVGPAGLDAMVYRDSSKQEHSLCLQPTVEVNPRYTMGRVALGLDRLLHPSTRALWLHVATRNSARLAAGLRERFPPKIRAGKLEEGVFPTNDPAQARAMLTILVAGSAVDVVRGELSSATESD